MLGVEEGDEGGGTDDLRPSGEEGTNEIFFIGLYPWRESPYLSHSTVYLHGFVEGEENHARGNSQEFIHCSFYLLFIKMMEKAD